MLKIERPDGPPRGGLSPVHTISSIEPLGVMHREAPSSVSQSSVVADAVSEAAFSAGHVAGWFHEV